MSRCRARASVQPGPAIVIVAAMVRFFGITRDLGHVALPIDENRLKRTTRDAKNRYFRSVDDWRKCCAANTTKI